MIDPTRWAQLLIEQLPPNHDGRNSWLLNFGTGEESDHLRADWQRAHPDHPEFRAVPGAAPQSGKEV